MASQLIEDCFNKVKHRTDRKGNSVCPAWAGMATIIDSKVLSVTHKYKEIDRTEELPLRASAFAPHTFKPVLQKSKLDAGIKAMNLTDIAGHGSPTWYSTGAAGYSQPYVDVALLRHAEYYDCLNKLDRRWLSQLVTPKMLFRRVGTPTWHFGMGSLQKSMAVGWPAKEVKPGCWLPDATNQHRKPFLVVDVGDWEAVEVELQSPLHQAVQIELDKLGGDASRSKEVELKALPFFLASGMSGSQCQIRCSEPSGSPCAELALLEFVC